VGPIRGYRNNIHAFPVQTLVAPIQANNDATTGYVTAAATDTRTFWGTDSTKNGQYFTKIVTTNPASAESSIAKGAAWVVCDSITTGTDCNGGASFQHAGATSGTPRTITKRIVMKHGSSAAISVGGTALENIVWNTDILVASFYHSSWSTLDDTGTKWCSPWYNKLLADATVITLTATNGLTGRSKCTWQLRTENGTVAPTVMLKTAAYVNFYFHWMEWTDDIGLGSGYALPPISGASFHLGNYIVADREVFLNPGKSGV